MIHVIIGAPCSGKSTYVKENRNDTDIVIDFDKMAQAFGSKEAHAAPKNIKDITFAARETAIKETCEKDLEAWIIHTNPTEKQMEMYEAAGAEFIEMTTDMETCLERCETDNRPPGTADIIRQFYEHRKGAFFMPERSGKMIKTKTYEVKADTGSITGYASTWTREPDSYGDVVAKGAFIECIERIKDEGKVLPLLFNHDGSDLGAFIGTVTDLEEDDHGLKFTATFDDTPEAQRARQLASDGRLAKFSFAYDILDQGTVELEDGREANELRKLNIHEVSLVLYPANPDTSVVEVKSETAGQQIIFKMEIDEDKFIDELEKEIEKKAGRRNSSKDEEKLRQIIALAQECLGELEDTEQEDEDNAEDQDTDNAEDQKADLLKEAEELLTKGAEA